MKLSDKLHFNRLKLCYEQFKKSYAYAYHLQHNPKLAMVVKNTLTQTLCIAFDVKCKSHGYFLYNMFLVGLIFGTGINQSDFIIFMIRLKYSLNI